MELIVGTATTEIKDLLMKRSDVASDHGLVHKKVADRLPRSPYEPCRTASAGTHRAAPGAMAPAGRSDPPSVTPF
jgi:hypothetical protein